MWRPGMELAGTIVLLELLAAGGVRGGQNQGTAGDLAEVGVISATGPEWPSANPRNLDNLPLPHLFSEGGGYNGTGIGIRSQPRESKPITNRRSPLLIGLYVSQGVLQGLDAQSTIRALHTGSAQEANPIVRPFASQPAALIAFKLAIAAGTIYGIDRLHKFHPRLATSMLGAINGGYAFLVQRNYRSFPTR
ncbi:MAG: DUF5658 family protein [Terriglobia bacterium]